MAQTTQPTKNNIVQEIITDKSEVPTLPVTSKPKEVQQVLTQTQESHIRPHRCQLPSPKS